MTFNKSYTDYWKTHKPNPVGLSKIDGWTNKWSVVYSNGTSKEVSLLWNAVPHRIRTYILYRRRIER